MIAVFKTSQFLEMAQHSHHILVDWSLEMISMSCLVGWYVYVNDDINEYIVTWFSRSSYISICISIQQAYLIMPGRFNLALNENILSITGALVIGRAARIKVTLTRNVLWPLQFVYLRLHNLLSICKWKTVCRYVNLRCDSAVVHIAVWHVNLKSLLDTRRMLFRLWPRQPLRTTTNTSIPILRRVEPFHRGFEISLPTVWPPLVRNGSNYTHTTTPERT